MNIFYTYFFSTFNCTDPDLGLRSRTFSLKMNNFNHSSMAMFKDCVLYGQLSSHIEFQLNIMFLTVDIDPTTPNIKTRTTHHKITQNHS